MNRLLQQTGKVLLDAEMDTPLTGQVRELIAATVPDAVVTDLHVWRVGKGGYACILALESEGPATADDVRRCLSVHPALVHVSVEINRRWRRPAPAAAYSSITPPGRMRR